MFYDVTFVNRGLNFFSYIGVVGTVDLIFPERKFLRISRIY